MSKLTWKDLEEKNIAIHTPTEDLMKLVTNIIAKKYDDITYEEHQKDEFNVGLSEGFCEYKEDTCVEINEDMDEFDSYVYEWSYADREFYLIEGFEIVEYEDVKHLFEDYIDTIETEEMKYLAKVKLVNGEENYFKEEWDQGECWLSLVEEIKYADTYTNLTTLKEILDIYKEEIEEYKIIKRTTITTSIFEFIE